MKRIVFIFLVIYIVNNGCEPKDNREYFRPKIAVKCFLQPNQVAKAYIENTVGLLDTSWRDEIFGNDLLGIIQPHYVAKNAKVILIKNGVFVDSLQYNSDTYLYEGTLHKIECGATYKIEIVEEGATLIYATCTVPYPVKIERIDTIAESKGIPASRTYILRFSDPVKENNFYLLYGFEMIKHDENWYHYRENRVYPILLNMDAIFENLPSSVFWPARFSDRMFNGKTLSLELTEKSGSYHSRDSLIWFNLANVSIEEYNYIESIERYKYNSNNAFAEPTPIYSNIVNGAGIFAAMAVSSDTIKIKK